MCSVPGYDASGLVRDLAAEQNKQITSVSIGKTQTFVRWLKRLHKRFNQKLSRNIFHLCTCLPFTGSAEGFNKADRDINTAVKSGR